jgi:ADP-heptose:LPS heptosyltransferase
VQHPKFILARFSSIGDIVMAAPVVQALRSHFGAEAQIDFITLNKFKGAAELISGIDTIYTVEKRAIEVAPKLKNIGYDCLIDLHVNIRTRALARALKIETLRVKKQNNKRIALVLGLNKNPVEHFVERSLKTIEPLSVKIDSSNPWGIINCSKPSLNLPYNYISVAAGATYEGKQIPQQILEEVISSVDSKFVIVGGRDMEELGSSLEKKFPNKVTNLCGAINLSETAYVMQNCEVALGGDTGAMHIATAVGAKLVSVWGCTRPSLGLAPWNAHPKSLILEPQNRGNRPCSRHGDKCRYKRSGASLCINDVSSGAIVDAIKTLLK